jgi:hypothetical protein
MHMPVCKKANVSKHGSTKYVAYSTLVSTAVAAKVSRGGWRPPVRSQHHNPLKFSPRYSSVLAVEAGRATASLTATLHLNNWPCLNAPRVYRVCASKLRAASNTKMDRYRPTSRHTILSPSSERRTAPVVSTPEERPGCARTISPRETTLPAKGVKYERTRRQTKQEGRGWQRKRN